ncbi:MAG: hypothetical protein O8C58_05795 [Candidatus Methanoperedens sp.]|nr:hypothetical protein [Candidatus Methanoperedens sp.]
MKFLNSEKAVSEVMGHMIILALTITGVAMIILVGVPILNKMQDMIIIRNAEQAYTVMDTRVSKVALGDTQKQIINIEMAEGSLSVIQNSSKSESYMLVELKNDSGAIITRIPVSMGKIVYRKGDREVAYEGGGVWSKYPEGSVMLSQPEFNYNGETITMPVVNISGNISVGGKGKVPIKMEKIGKAQIIYPNITNLNPLSENVTTITVTIKSEYYDAWADYFRTIALTRVNTTASEKKVTVILDPPPVFMRAEYGALASETIEMKNNAKTYSYNSSNGPYPASQTQNGSIRAAKLITIGNGAIVNGSVMSGTDITGGGSATKACYARSYGSVTCPTKYPEVLGLSVGRTTSIVQGKIGNYQSSNNNNDPSAGGCLSGPNNYSLDSGAGGAWSSGTCTMYSGNYYLTKFLIDNNKKLILNTTSGPVNMALESSDFIAQNNANITIYPPDTAYPTRIYLKTMININNNALINTASNDRSYLFQFISSNPNPMDLSNNADVVAFIWAPQAEITLSNNMNLYGAVIGKKFIIGNNHAMYYDEALQNYDLFEELTSTLKYIYLTRNDLAISTGE